MNSVKIIVINEEGRPVNPHDKYTFGSGALSQAWAHFEKDVEKNPAPGIKDGTHMARLQWQYLHPVRKDWNTISDSSGDWERTHKIWQAWVLSPDGEKLPEIDFDSNTLNPDNYDNDGHPLKIHRKDTQKAQSVEKPKLNKKDIAVIINLLHFASDGWYTEETFDADLFKSHTAQEKYVINLIKKINGSI